MGDEFGVSVLLGCGEVGEALGSDKSGKLGHMGAPTVVGGLVKPFELLLSIHYFFFFVNFKNKNNLEFFQSVLSNMKLEKYES